jgi:hypothetical protein
MKNASGASTYLIEVMFQFRQTFLGVGVRESVLSKSSSGRIGLENEVEIIVEQTSSEGLALGEERILLALIREAVQNTTQFGVRDGDLVGSDPHNGTVLVVELGQLVVPVVGDVGIVGAIPRGEPSQERSRDTLPVHRRVVVANNTSENLGSDDADEQGHPLLPASLEDREDHLHDEDSDHLQQS